MNKITDQVQNKAKTFSLSLLIAILIFAFLLFLFWQITDEIVYEKEGQLDLEVDEWFANYRSPALTKFMTFITFFGSRAFLLPTYVLIIAYYLFHKKLISQSLGIAAVALIGAGILRFLKNIFKRTRPLNSLVDHPTSFSYPSGHSFSAFTFCGIIVYIVWTSDLSKTWKWTLTFALLLFAITICISRVYLQVHFASDVVAGFCLSFLWLSICYFILSRFNLIKRFPK